MKSRYKIVKEDGHYFVYLAEYHNKNCKIPMVVSTELEAVILANCLESEYRAGLIDGAREERFW